MTPSIRFYRDQTGSPCVQAIPEHLAPADYLKSDIQDSGTGKELLATLDTVADQGEKEVSGNAYLVTLSVDQVVLENLFDDDEAIYRFPVAQFKALVRDWLEFLDNDGLIALVPEF